MEIYNKKQEELQGNTIIVDHPYYIEAKNELRRCIDSFGKPNLRCIPILGPSGTGKSTVIEEFAKEYEKIETENGVIRPVLLIETPSRPTVKTMASSVLKGLEDPLYFKGTEVQMTDRIITQFKEQKVRLLIFDEIHQIVDRESDKLNHIAAEWLKGLLNDKEYKVPIAIVGIERAEKLFSNEQLRRRFKNVVSMKAFDWREKESQNYLRGFLKAIQSKFKFEKGLSLPSKEMAYRFYCASGGLITYIMGIIYEAEEIANEKYEPVITMRDLAEAYSRAVCGNHLIGVNPFETISTDQLQAALAAVRPGQVTKEIESRELEEQKRT